MKMKIFNKIRPAKNNTKPYSWFRIGHQAAGCKGISTSVCVFVFVVYITHETFGFIRGGKSLNVDQ